MAHWRFDVAAALRLLLALGALSCRPCTAAAEEVCDARHPRGQDCAAGAATALAREHVMLQVGTSRFQVRKGAGDAGATAGAPSATAMVASQAGREADGAAGFCCFWSGADPSSSCGSCGAVAPADQFCGMSEGNCVNSCKATWCPGSSGAQSPQPVPEPAPTQAPLPATAPAPPTSGGPVLVWSDEFDGGALDTAKWSYRTGGGGFGNEELQFYTSSQENVRTENGALNIIGKCDRQEGSDYTSGRLQSIAAWGPGHRVEVRARLPTARGVWPAIWMLPRDNAYGGWPKSGEIDIMESVGCDPDRVHGTIHTEAFNHMIHTEKTSNTRTDVRGWHVYRVDWTPTTISWYVDGQPYFSYTPGNYAPDQWPFDKEFYLILNVAIGGSWGGMCLMRQGPPCAPGAGWRAGQVMQVDYARVWAIGDASLVQEQASVATQ